MRLFVFPILALAFPCAMLPLASSFPLTPPLLAHPPLLLPSAACHRRHPYIRSSSFSSTGLILLLLVCQCAYRRSTMWVRWASSD
ncbi:hypothetical protein BDP81DRAFT_422697 [Colletotrichum phormii]|uniref:Secreted peptide n=1 Tax=Colletotrichum phormii TaxID=359342 RepID=A0AAI9ZYD3_9PEZI|nr:uncharacterized protein BDP81DRAFT_422697 [Colletotrichum phormii]KAK1638807.1 hypothetical protein BDP81DRAFT_422697 [Colletotrichum phormii]